MSLTRSGSIRRSAAFDPGSMRTVVRRPGRRRPANEERRAPDVARLHPPGLGLLNEAAGPRTRGAARTRRVQQPLHGQEQGRRPGGRVEDRRRPDARRELQRARVGDARERRADASPPRQSRASRRPRGSDCVDNWRIWRTCAAKRSGDRALGRRRRHHVGPRRARTATRTWAITRHRRPPGGVRVTARVEAVELKRAHP